MYTFDYRENENEADGFYVNAYRRDATGTMFRETIADGLTETEAAGLVETLEPLADRLNLWGWEE